MTEGAWYTDLDAFLAKAGGSRTVYNRFRIPRLPPVEDDVSQPGHLCWGSVGSLPTAEPVPVMGFQVVEPQERNEEITRQSTTIRIEQEGNPQNYMLIDRADEILFKTKHPGWTTATGSNTDGASDFGDFAPTPIELTSFKPLGTEKEGRLLVKFNNKGPG
jgi:hypothetical protein